MKKSTSESTSSMLLKPPRWSKLLFFTAVISMTTLFIVTSIPDSVAQVGCECNEYVYLNETTTGGAVHKFLVNADGTFTEIGSPWYDNTVTGDDLEQPHGLGVDLNGFLYIGEKARSTSEIRKLDCNGNIFPESEFAFTTGGQTNIVSDGNSIFYNNRNNLLHYGDFVEVDVCSQQVLGTVDFCDASYGGLTGGLSGFDWGFYKDIRTNTMYATTGWNTGTQEVFIFNLTDFDNDPATCIDPITLGTALPDVFITGITTDADENMYIVTRGPNECGTIYKYGPGPNYPLLATSATDCNEDGTGYAQAIGIVYSETTNLLYVSTLSAIDDCVSTFDTSLVYLGSTVPSPGTGDNAKGIAITKECCPTSSSVVIDTGFCASVGDNVFLQELIDCEGTICEGMWTEAVGNTGMTYNSCNNSITIDALGGCGTFTIASNGAAANAQCPAFEITMNICATVTPDAPTIAVTDNDCATNTPGAFSVTTPCGAGSTLEWSTDNGTTWSTTAPTYDANTIQTVIARCANDADNACAAEAVPITTNPDASCAVNCPTPNCFGITIQQN